MLDGLRDEYLDLVSTSYADDINETAKNLELILVDNNSSDDTANLVNSYEETLPVKYVLETEQGLSFARNRGIKEASGDYIAFLDDDISLSPSWLCEACRLVKKLFEDKDSSAPAVIGGKVIPVWEKEKPSWLNLEPPFEITQSVFPSHDYGDVPRMYPIEDKGRKIQNPLGANMMFRKDVFEKYGDFRSDLGTSASGGLGLHEDTEYCRMLAEHGEALMYMPQCSVFHPVPEARMQKDFVRGWYKKSGRSLFWMIKNKRSKLDPLADSFVGVPYRFKSMLPRFLESSTIAGAPLYLYMKLFSLQFIWLISHLSFNPKLTFWLSIQIAKNEGEFEAARLVKQAAECILGENQPEIANIDQEKKAALN